MSKAYRYVKSQCCICKNRHDCYRWRQFERGEAMDYGTLLAIGNCSRWDQEKKEKDGEK